MLENTWFENAESLTEAPTGTTVKNVRLFLLEEN